MSRQSARAIAAAGLIIVCSVAWLAFKIPKGILANTDELLTAERTREMLLTEPWIVHFNFQRSFEKPPLQYWLTTLTLPRFENRTLAVRVWPLVYGALTAIALGWLVFLVAPAWPWLIPTCRRAVGLVSTVLGRSEVRDKKARTLTVHHRKLQITLSLLDGTSIKSKANDS